MFDLFSSSFFRFEARHERERETVEYVECVEWIVAWWKNWTSWKLVTITRKVAIGCCRAQMLSSKCCFTKSFYHLDFSGLSFWDGERRNSPKFSLLRKIRQSLKPDKLWLIIILFFPVDVSESNHFILYFLLSWILCGFISQFWNLKQCREMAETGVGNKVNLEIFRSFLLLQPSPESLKQTESPDFFDDFEFRIILI